MKRIEVKDPSDPHCGKCKYFRQHYVRYENRNKYMECNHGHCTYRHLRSSIRPLNAACESYEEKPAPIRFRLKRRAFQRVSTSPKKPGMRKKPE